jgi:AcrR family transcriptional regulator
VGLSRVDQGTGQRLSTEERVRQAALRLFAAKGFEATGIRDIATEAGISVASLYHYMSTKDELLQAIMEYGLKRLHRQAAWTLEQVDGPVEQLAALVQLHVWTHGVRQQSALVVDREIRSLSGESLERIRALRDGYEQLWRDVIRRGVVEEIMHVVDPKLTSFALLEMCTGVSHWFSATGELTLSYIAEVYADSALALVRATRGRRPVRITELRLPRPEDAPDMDPSEAADVTVP